MAYTNNKTETKKNAFSSKSLMLAIGILMIAFGSYKLFEEYNAEKQEEQRVQIEQKKKEYEKEQQTAVMIQKEKDKKVYHDFLIIVTEWNDAISVADKTPRVSLSGPISEMQKIRREAYDFKANECLLPAKEKLVSSMDALVDFYITFMGNQIPNRIVAEQATNQIVEVSNDYVSCLNSI